MLVHKYKRDWLKKYRCTRCLSENLEQCCEDNGESGQTFSSRIFNRRPDKDDNGSTIQDDNATGRC